MKAIESPTFRGATEVIIRAEHSPTEVGMIVLAIAEKLAIATCEPDGEDSAGRSKWKLMRPTDVAERACEIAHELYVNMHSRGWYINVPLPKPAVEKD